MLAGLSRCAFALLAVSAAAVMDSCTSPVQFLHPLGDSSTRVFVEQVSGQWQPISDGENSNELWTFTPADDKSHYKLTITKGGGGPAAEKDGPSVLRVELARLNGQTFADFTLDESSFHDDYDIFALPLHLFGRIDADDGNMRLVLLEDNWLDRDRATQGGWAFVTPKTDQLLITAPTEQLQQLVLKWSGDSSVEKKETKFQRSAPPDK